MRYIKLKDISTENKTDTDKMCSKYNEESNIIIPIKPYLSEDKDQN